MLINVFGYFINPKKITYLGEWHAYAGNGENILGSMVHFVGENEEYGVLIIKNYIPEQVAAEINRLIKEQE